MFEYTQPIFGAAKIDKKKNLILSQPVIFGTTFHYANGLFITAGHVLKEAINAGGSNVGFHDKATRGSIPICPDWYELNESLDVGLMYFSKPGFFRNLDCSLIDDEKEIKMLTDVSTSGFPFAVDAQSRKMLIRSFKGYIVAPATYFDLKAKPRIYELSFAAPKGLSGAPLLLSERGEEMCVAGVILGSKESTLDIISTEEVIEEGQKCETITVKHYLQLGVALQMSQLKDVKVQKLECSLSEYRK